MMNFSLSQRARPLLYLTPRAGAFLGVDRGFPMPRVEANGTNVVARDWRMVQNHKDTGTLKSNTGSKANLTRDMGERIATGVPLQLCQVNGLNAQNWSFRARAGK